MFLFHGTKAKHLRAIKAQGLRPSVDWNSWWWGAEMGLPPSVFLSNEPKAGEGSSPVGFARAGLGDGYIVVFDVPQAELAGRLRGIWKTSDIDTYYKISDLIDPYYEKYYGEYHGNVWDSRDSKAVMRLIEDRDPDLAGKVRLGTGFIKRDPEWLLKRRCSKPSIDCQFLISAMPACFIKAVVKVFDAKSGKILPEFNPKFQAKRKHKLNSFADLFWNHVRR